MPRRACLLVLVLALSAALAGCLRDFEEPEEPSRVSLHDIDVAAGEVTTGSVTLEVTTTLDNGGGPSGVVNLTVRAYDSRTGLRLDTAHTSIGTMEANVTESPTVTLRVPREHGVRIQVDVHESDQIRKTGRVEVRNLDGLDPTDHDTPLGVGEMDFVVREVTTPEDENRTQQVRIETRVYLTNEGDQASAPIRSQVKAREANTSLIADETWTDVPAVSPGGTHISSVNLTVPDEHNYVIQVALWEDQFVLERGQGTVQLLPTFVREEGEELGVSDPDVRDFERPADRRDRARDGGAPEGGAGVPGPGPLIAAAAGVGAALAARKRTRGGRP